MYFIVFYNIFYLRSGNETTKYIIEIMETERKRGRPKVESVKMQLSLPKYMGEWVEQKSRSSKFCRNKQSFIQGLIEDQMRKEESNTEQLEMNL